MDGIIHNAAAYLQNGVSDAHFHTSTTNQIAQPVDFEVEDLNGDVRSFIIVEGRASDGKDVGGSSDEGAFKNVTDIRVDQVPLDATHERDSSASGDEPYVGQEFESEAAAHAFYNAYGNRLGFVIRVSKLSRSRRDGTPIGRALVCNKEGFRMLDKREKIVRQRAETRVGCRAMIKVRKMSSGDWIVTKFVKEHTHPLTPGKGRRDLIFDQYPNEHDKIKELTQQLAMERKRACTYKRHLELIFEHIEEHNEFLSSNNNNNKRTQYIPLNEFLSSKI